MRNDTVVRFRKKDEVVDPLSELLRDGAQRLISQAVSAELELFLEHHSERRDGEGRRAVVRNGYLPQREVLTGIGPVTVRVPKVRDRSEASACFRSGLVPRYVRRARSVEAVLPWLYLKGVSTGNMQEALTALLGEQARGLSAPVISRLKAGWTKEYEAWRKRELGKERWVYVWADGIYSSLRAEETRLCLLVIIGVN